MFPLMAPEVLTEPPSITPARAITNRESETEPETAPAAGTSSDRKATKRVTSPETTRMLAIGDRCKPTKMSKTQPKMKGSGQ